MPETITVTLVGTWLLGLVTATTLGGFVHVLLVVAILMVLVRAVRIGPNQRPTGP